MKKTTLLSLVLILALLLALTACTAAPEPIEDISLPEEKEPVQEDKKEEPEAPAETKPETPAEQEKTEEPAEQDKAEAPEEETPEAPAGQEEQEPEAPAESAVDLEAVYEALVSGTDMPDMIRLDEGMMLDYCGIEAADCRQAVVVICADSLRTDEVWLLEAVSEEAAAALVELAGFRLEMKAEESISYSPEQYEVVQKARLVQNGVYVALLVSPESDAMEEIFGQAFAE